MALLAVAVAGGSGRVHAANPAITGVFTADPAAMVYEGKVYLYTGHDEAPLGGNGYVMKEWLCFSSADMVTWKAEGSPMALTAFGWALQDAWAGHVIERDGKFYYYVPMSHRTITGFAIGVGVSDSPTGPFVDARGSALITNNMTADSAGRTSVFSWDDIDPAVFIDDDGQAYLFWGNTICHYVKLKSNMIEIDGAIQTVSLPLFTEAPWVHKRNGLYYLSYAYGWEEKIAYATSTSITGPWIYRGVINDYVYNCNTNHQAIIEFKGQSFFIYHNGGAPQGGSFRRSVCVDYLAYNADGTIQPVVQTAQGIVAAAPVFTAQPMSQTVAADGSVTLTVAAGGTPLPGLQWARNGADITGATGGSHTITAASPADTGLYTVAASNFAGTATSAPVILGLSSTTKVVGAGREVGSDIFVASNGNTFDQVLLEGGAAAVKADYDPDPAKNQITRTSFVDADNDIVQVEFSGPGTLSLVLQDSSGPALPVNYNQDVSYMKGHAGIVITGADEHTNVAVFSVGRGTAVNQALFKDGVSYDGIADIAFLAIMSTNGKFGGVRTANANYFGSRGITGIYAPGVEFVGPVYVGNLTAFDAATPMLLLGGATGDTLINGGDLHQANGRAVQVKGLTQLKFVAGTTSHSVALPAQANQARLEQDGVDVTAQIVVNPGP